MYGFIGIFLILKKKFNFYISHLYEKHGFSLEQFVLQIFGLIVFVFENRFVFHTDIITCYGW